MIAKPRLPGFGNDARIAAEIDAARAAGEGWATTCLNCGAPLSGHFCAKCGQRVVPTNPTMHELAGEALSEFAGWDGKLAGTAKLLFRKPGALTCEYLEGRRARYIQPLRLYLTCSVAFFLLAAASPPLNNGMGLNVSTSESPVAAGKSDRVAIPITGGNRKQMSDAERKRILAETANAPRLMRPMMRRAALDPAGFQHDVFEAMPKGLFVLLPIYACILAIFYRRRHFTEHLYFALHLHAFAFLVLALNEVLKFTRSVSLTAWAGSSASIWIVVYAHLAFRRVYGGSHIVTFAKEIGLLVLYFTAMIPTMVAVAMWVAAS